MVFGLDDGVALVGLFMSVVFCACVVVFVLCVSYCYCIIVLTSFCVFWSSGALLGVRFCPTPRFDTLTA